MMKKGKEFDNILDECLERILTRGETIEQCLALYPEQAAELEPLLETVLVTKNALAIKPRPEFRDRARYQLRVALQEVEQKREKRFSFFSWQPRWATAVVAVLVLLLAGSGTVAAAGNSMPDQPLYPVKLATERVRLALTPSALGKAELYAALAEKRVAEIINMAEKGKSKQVERTAQRLNAHLTKIVSLTLPVGEEAGMLLAPAPPAVREAPAPSVEIEPPDEETGMIMAPAPPATVEKAPVVPEVREGGPGERVEPDKWAKLRVVLASNAVKHPAALRAILREVPESMRPALLRAIEDSDAEYEKVLHILRGRGRH